MLKMPKFSKVPKMRLRKRHLKRALMITAYLFVAIVTVVGIVAPSLRF